MCCARMVNVLVVVFFDCVCASCVGVCSSLLLFDGGVCPSCVVL